MEMSFDATNNTPAKQEAHPLELDSVPPLVVSTKPAGKNDGDTSVRTSSPAFTDVPATPIKGAKKSQSAQVRERSVFVRCLIETIYVTSTLCFK